METRESLIDGVMVVELIGQRLDAATAPVFKGKMIDLINKGNSLFLLDFTRLDFMDSSGLGSLISCVKSLGGDGALALFGLRESVRKIFSVTRLDRGVFRIFESRDEALKSLAGRKA
ncbi:MAG: STAS domain-containing protein [Desulfovibrio sp.]|nr:STAS domain-containing protein [Desulfovibrio sp.]MBI4960755.1 STAS domain-containing protein [Desulfovibrio sp.]